MITFFIGVLILLFGYIFYSKYVENQFMPDDRETPAYKLKDGIDYVPLGTEQNMLIHLLNIAGLGPILGAIQGVLFGPVAFILIPLGCIFMGGVHDYFGAMISVRNDGAQITELIKKYLGNNVFKIFIVIISIMLLLLTCVFIYTSGDIIAEGFFDQKDFSLNNPLILTIYLIIITYFILATMLPIDKIIAKLYPAFTIILILGSAFIFVGVFTNHFAIPELNFHHINLHPDKLHILPMFFMTVSCGLLSGFHSTQSTLISRTIKNEKDGKKVFYGMMCLESLIAMVWALASYCIYANHLAISNVFGTARMIDAIADNFTVPILSLAITIGAVILPITSGDTALRALRLTIGDFLKIKQNKLINRFKIIIPMTIVLGLILYWAKTNANSFSLIWRYFTFANQLITIPTLAFATIFLYQQKKNYFITLLPCLFYVFITSFFIINSNIGFQIPFKTARIIAIFITILMIIYFIKKLKTVQK